MKISGRGISKGMAAAALALAAAVSGSMTASAQQTESAPVKIFTFAKTEDSVKQAAADAKSKAETQKQKKNTWEKQIIADVDHYLNIREKPTTKSRVIGKLYRGSGATIKKKGTDWTKIVSGKVTGYVKNEYCAFGTEAQKLAGKLCDTHAVVKEDGLRIREKADTNAKILTLLDKGQSVKVTKTKNAKDGWVEVLYDGKKAYLAEDYVKVGLHVEKAVSVSEEQEKVQAEAADTANTVNGENTGNGSEKEAVVETSASVSQDDLTLLAAIIECEAGGEPYAGQLAVGAVVLNRVQSSEFPDTIAGVIYQKGQFTPVRSGKLSRVLKSGDIGKSCYQAAQEALDGSDNTGCAKYFHAGTTGSGQVIGTQIFY